MRILVTGGTGFIGSHLVDALIEDDHNVVTISRQARAAHPVAEHITCDVSDAAVLDGFGHLDAIVHLAASADASASFADPVRYSQINALGTLNMLETARKAGAYFIFASTQRIYRPQNLPLREDAALDPVDPYGYSKLIGEHWVRMYRDLFGVRTSVLRFFSVYGPGQLLRGGTSGVVNIFVNRALQGAPIRVTDGNLRDFTYVTDVVKGIMLAVENPIAIGRTYNIATGVTTSIGALAQLVKQVTDSSSEVVITGHDPIESYVASIDKAADELGYVPSIELRRGLELYVRQLKETR
jgi:UDP-glucose 4-epimerase